MSLLSLSPESSLFLWSAGLGWHRIVKGVAEKVCNHGNVLKKTFIEFSRKISS